MANSHVPYLQTLAKDEAIAFVSSLQKVKEHLSHELQWMNEQVQQKTMQLQGIDTLLAEAVGLGLVPLHAASTATDDIKPSSVGAVLSSVSQPTPSLSDPATLAAANGSNLASATALEDAAVSSSEALPSTSTAPPQRGKQRQQSKSPQSKLEAKRPAAGKTNTPKAKPGRPPHSSTEATSSGFQKFLQAGFQDQSMTDAVGEILTATKEPMNTDAIMAKLYDGLSDESYQRAKSSLSNILSVGKSKGKWKSPGRGLYAGS